jgi:hypothetical protein
MNIGIDATLQYNKIYKRNLVSKPVPKAGVVVPNMFQVGFVLNADAIVNFKSKITGNVLVGGSMEISNFDAKVDILRGTGSQSGWSPSFKFDPSRDFQAAGKVTASVAVSMPVEFVFGITIIRMSCAEQADSSDRLQEGHWYPQHPHAHRKDGALGRYSQL